MTPASAALASSASTNSVSLARLSLAASKISSACAGTLSLRTVTAPSAACSSTRRDPGAAITDDFSEPKKSSPGMDLTSVLESPDQSLSLCGLALAKSFTGPATRRSLLPSRSTGLTALPMTLPYLAAMAASSSESASPEGYLGTSKPFPLSSAMACSSWYTDAETLGSLMMFARLVLARSPSLARTSTRLWAGVRRSGKAARMRAAREISAVSTLTPLGLRKRRTTGRKACVARAGASSVSVHQILADFLMPSSGTWVSSAVSSIPMAFGARRTRGVRRRESLKACGCTRAKQAACAVVSVSVEARV
mmetsp:Transcript_8915/g.40504  ORF Transcript_8915/g.40504 Transcript_8915/m.40504 type:complete len:308 (+) Transcript_8915:3015-3938(+)